MKKLLNLKKSLSSLVLRGCAFGLPICSMAVSHAQMLMNLAPQGIHNSTAGQGYSHTLGAFKQAVDQPSQFLPIKNQTGSAPDSNTKSVGPPAPNKASQTTCLLKVYDMNRIQRHEVVRVVSSDCMMVFNANE